MRHLIISSMLLAFGCGSSATSSLKEAWNTQNNPIVLGQNYQVNFNVLPSQGQTTRMPWSDTYWPSYQGGISQRWRDNVNNFTYQSPDQFSVSQMTAGQIAKLSPAEKYDLLISRYDYPLVAYERQRTRPTNESWEGLCHGWAPAAINFDEPHSVVVSNAQGVQIPFGASDVKALLTLYQGQIAQEPFRILGERCNLELSTLNPNQIPRECRDANAGAFHVVLANQVGILNQSFVLDVNRDLQVWNQPVFGFSTHMDSQQAPSQGAAIGTVREVVMTTQMAYTVEVLPTWNSLVGTPRNGTSTKTYRYRLELDAADNIIGGEWLTDDRPDFLWTRETPTFSGYFQTLGWLLQASLQSPGVPEPTF